ncbi:MAG: HAMP domain-containing protein [Chloroflexi bacterium]|nr:HAMP domain-containing protein [Chloroflexota bacterium]
MNDYLRSHFGAKLLLSYLVIVVVGVIVLILASQFALPASFNRHMGMMDGGMGMGNGMMMWQNNDSMSQLYIDFRASFNEALLYATFAATVAAMLLSFFFTRRVIAPVQAMSQATQRIADGRYDERVQVSGEDELAQLATRFNQMAEKLNQVESMRRRLIGDVSHELRTPLTAIKGSMEGLMDGILPATDETFQQVHAEADRLNRLVDDLQELSRVEARAYQLDIRSVNISSLVQTVTKRLAAKAQAKRITLDFDLNPNLPPVLADEDRAIQILTNLTGNALQYTPEGGRITISANQVKDEIQIAIHDTGVGIPAEHLPHIFDRFYRVDKSRSRQAGGGSGIGLTIAHALIEAQHGRIWVESAGDGNGSTFTFTLPIVENG